MTEDQIDLANKIKEGASVRCGEACEAAALIGPGHLTVVMHNLIQNAISHRVSDRVPEVTASCGPAGNMIEIRVADNGPGIEESMRERVFEMFVKDSHAGGTGIGLALVKRIVRNAKGEVRIEDNKPGTVVIVTLPAAPNPDGLACCA
ncbi:MAG: HAMP domain-containing sensor histidine kinase [Candidatus Nanopelagicales bacterium]|nr:HAMP domain-containing sensor histidine kinase [Candidatus Nanopelagicales bacterium]